ncbi:MAG: cell division protein ZapA [Thermodesulfobacteriota bacterium]
MKFELLGQQFSFYTAAPEDEVAEIINMVTRLVEENSGGKSGTISVGKIAVLASLNMASNYVELRRRFERHKEETDRRIGLLSAAIDKGLSTGKES